MRFGKRAPLRFGKGAPKRFGKRAPMRFGKRVNMRSLYQNALQDPMRFLRPVLLALEETEDFGDFMFSKESPIAKINRDQDLGRNYL